MYTHMYKRSLIRSIIRDKIFVYESSGYIRLKDIFDIVYKYFIMLVITFTRVSRACVST